MAIIQTLDRTNRKEVKDFINLPFELYKDNKYWVPPFISEMKDVLNPAKHPFYKHSVAEFFVAYEGDKIVGRIAAMENIPFNEYHKTKKGSFYFFECIEDFEVAKQLFNAAIGWCKDRGLNLIVGPKGFSPFDGYGLVVEGYNERQMMTMMNYNPPYYVKFVEELGFEKYVDFVSCYIDLTKFEVPEKVTRVAERVVEKGTFEILNLESTQDAKDWALRIGHAYNKSFINNWEYYPITDEEIEFTLKSVLTVADPKLLKFILKNGEIVGFIFGFKDLSAALQRGKGKLTPWAIADILLENRRTRWLDMNGIGILPEYQGMGGAALMYHVMNKVIHEYEFDHCEMSQVAESAVQMRKDLITLGGKPYKNHRVFQKAI